MSRKDKRKKEKSVKRKKYFLWFLEIVFITLMIISAIKIIIWIKENKASKKILDEISSNIVFDENTEYKYTINFERLKQQNEETVGWIKVYGTDIEYPVVKHNDNIFYLNHSFDKSYNKAGWIFADYKNKMDGTDKNIVIYGHNRRNNSMFGTLKNILNKEWYNNEENREILFFTENEKNIYEVFSIYRIEDEDYYIKTDFSKYSFSDFIKTIKKRSIVDFDVDVTKEDSIITLSTCDNNNDYRIVLHAKKLSIQD